MKGGTDDVRKEKYIRKSSSSFLNSRLPRTAIIETLSAANMIRTAREFIIQMVITKHSQDLRNQKALMKSMPIS